MHLTQTSSIILIKLSVFMPFRFRFWNTLWMLDNFFVLQSVPSLSTLSSVARQCLSVQVSV